MNDNQPDHNLRESDQSDSRIISPVTRQRHSSIGELPEDLPRRDLRGNGDGSDEGVGFWTRSPHVQHQPTTEKDSRGASESEGIEAFRTPGKSEGLEGLIETPYRYHEIIKDSYSTNALVKRYDKLELRAHHTPLWKSYFAFSLEVVEYLKTHQRILKSYPHPVGINEIIIDLDTKDGVTAEQVLDEARRLVKYLIQFLEVPSEYIRVFFSGSKGYHIHLPNLFGFRPDDTLPAVVKATLTSTFDFCESMDTTMIRKNGLIRVPYSRHQETGLYKQPLPFDMFFSDSVESIKAYSRIPIYMPWSLPDEIETSLARLKSSPTIQKRGVYVDSTNTTTRVTCMQKLWNRGAEQGRGHKDSLRIASWLRRMGIPRDAALIMLQGWYGFVDTDDQGMIINSVYDKKYTYSCDDEVMREFCDDKCMFHSMGWNQEDHETMVNDSTKLMAGLQKYKSKIEEDGGIDLQKIWPSLKEPYVILPGEAAMFTGDTGMGKSSLVQGIVVRQFAHVKKSVLYLNNEMNEALCFRRFLQVAHGYTKKEAFSAVGRINSEYLLNPLNHIQMVSIAPKHTQVLDAVKAHKPDILVIDTTDAIEVPEAGNNDQFQMKVVIEMMLRLAHQYNMIVIGIHHLSKEGSKKGFVDLNSLTGNRAAVTKMDHVFAITGNPGRPERKLICLKARDDEKFNLNILFDGARMQMSDADTGTPLFGALDG